MCIQLGIRFAGDANLVAQQVTWLGSHLTAVQNLAEGPADRGLKGAWGANPANPANLIFWSDGGQAPRVASPQQFIARKDPEISQKQVLFGTLLRLGGIIHEKMNYVASKSDEKQWVTPLLPLTHPHIYSVPLKKSFGEQQKILSRAHKTASSPFLSIKLRSLREGPLGRLSPASHFLTVETLVFNTAASTV